MTNSSKDAQLIRYKQALDYAIDALKRYADLEGAGSPAEEALLNIFQVLLENEED
jgi:hypothetical protein